MKITRVEINLSKVNSLESLFEFLRIKFGGFGENIHAFIDTITDSWLPPKESISNFFLKKGENLLIKVNGIRETSDEIIFMFLQGIVLANAKLVEMGMKEKIIILPLE